MKKQNKLIDAKIVIWVVLLIVIISLTIYSIFTDPVNTIVAICIIAGICYYSFTLDKRISQTHHN